MVCIFALKGLYSKGQGEDRSPEVDGASCYKRPTNTDWLLVLPELLPELCEQGLFMFDFDSGPTWPIKFEDID